jgi:hypothetical protein
MLRKRVRTVLALGAAATVIAGMTPAFAQDQPPGPYNGPPPPDYNGPPPQGYNDQQQPPPPGYNDQQQPPPGYNDQQPPPQGYNDQEPPQGYEGQPPQGQDQAQRYNVPPPAGYGPNDYNQDNSPQARQEDARYSYAAEQWAAQNCIQQQQNATAAGAVIGGIFGAFLGAGIAGHYNQGAGAVVGAGLGAVTGAAIGNASAQSNPACPPGYALRAGAPGFYAPVVYAAPGWYDPWIWYGGHWLYRPYPYHRFYYGHAYGHGRHW